MRTLWEVDITKGFQGFELVRFVPCRPTCKHRGMYPELATISDDWLIDSSPVLLGLELAKHGCPMEEETDSRKSRNEIRVNYLSCYSTVTVCPHSTEYHLGWQRSVFSSDYFYCEQEMFI